MLGFGEDQDIVDVKDWSKAFFAMAPLRDPTDPHNYLQQRSGFNPESYAGLFSQGFRRGKSMAIDPNVDVDATLSKIIMVFQTGIVREPDSFGVAMGRLIALAHTSPPLLYRASPKKLLNVKAALFSKSGGGSEEIMVLLRKLFERACHRLALRDIDALGLREGFDCVNNTFVLTTYGRHFESQIRRVA